MNMEQERTNIIQPHSWETIIALEARRPLEELTSSPAPTALHATARAFIISTYQKPTLYSTKHLAECIFTYNRRQEQWQKRQEELREDDEDILDELEEQEASFAVQHNVRLGALNTLQEKINYYTDLLAIVQQAAADSSFLWGQIPTTLTPKKQRECFGKLLKNHHVIFTPAKVVETIKRCIQYYRLQYSLLVAKTAAQNADTLGYSQAVEEELSQCERFASIASFSATQTLSYLDAVTRLPAPEDLEMFLDDLAFSADEENYVDAWYALQEDFFAVTPFPVPQQDEVLIAEVVPQPSAPSPLALPEPKPLTLNPQKKLKLPKIHHKTTLLNVCKFFYGLSQDDAFATVPTTSQGVKALIDKLPTPAFTQLYSRLVKGADMQLAVQYRFAVRLLGDFYNKLQEQECQAQTHKGLSEIAAFGRTDCPVQEDPAKDYRTKPQDPVAYLNNEEENSLSEDEIQA